MQALYKFLFSTRLMGVLLFVFAASIGIATFVEDSYDTVAAKELIYNAKWFELVIVLLVINFIGNIGKYRLLRKEKIISLLFHLAFIIIIIGAGVTRYVGFEGTMVIKEGETSNKIFSSEKYLQVNVHDGENQVPITKLLRLNELTDNSFSVSYDFPGKGSFEITHKRFIKNAIVETEEDEEGVALLEIMLGGRKPVQIYNGDIKENGGLVFAFNNNTRPDAIQFIGEAGNLKVIAPYDLLSRNMSELSVDDRERNPSDLGFDTLKRDTVNQIGLRYLLFTQGKQIMVNRIYKAKSILRRGADDESGRDVLVINLNHNDEDVEIPLFDENGYPPDPTFHQQGDLFFKLGYGTRLMELPFSIKLGDFVLDRYPGSMSPSSFLSDVTLIDERSGIEEDHRIFMNNVLDHDGYRFFQSNYLPDESGTVLSVNHDFWGTWITYLGYLLLAIGFILALINPKGRFRELRKKSAKVRKKRASQFLTIALLFISVTGLSQVNVVSSEAADQFARVMVQSNGRFQPAHTLAYDIFHKVSKKDKFNFPEVGEVDAMQLYLDIPLNPGYWAQQKLIYVRANSGVRELLEMEGAYASVNDFMMDSLTWVIDTTLLRKFNESNAKKPVEQSGTDKELIKVNERLNILMMTFLGDMYMIVPVEGSETDEWVSAVDSLAYAPIKDHESGMDISYAVQFTAYMIYLDSSKINGNDSIPARILESIISQQRKWDVKGLLPSEDMVELEIYYNKTNIFKTLERTYSMLAVFLLILTLVQNIKEKKNKILDYAVWFFIGILGLAFVYHTYGLGVRWYLTGHAPWSNGYEALVFIAWGTLLAGFLFIRSSKITLAGTALLAFLILMTAGHSSFDPQLTNLEPVLKSYWLVIHVACITASYSFLALGFILGVINIFLYLFKTVKNQSRLNLIVTELTYVNEMVLLIGVVLATIGTFLGGVWANESWGRYWGWDAKETWALVIVLVYAIVLHLRFMPGKAKGKLTFNIATVLSFSTVLMTFFGVNFLLSKGLHSYARGDAAVLPIWVWVTSLVFVLLCVFAILRENKLKKSK